MPIDLKLLCDKVCVLLAQTAEMINHERENFRGSKGIEVKGHSDFVTYIDKMSEMKLVDELGQLLPEAGFIAEEGTSTKKGETYNWVIDPIDGTTNFIHGLTPHAISVALMRNKQIVLGVVHEISHNEVFKAWEGSLAFLNDKQIGVSTAAEHQQALIATGFPYYDLDRVEIYLDSMREIMQKTTGIRRLGSAAIDICYVACGRFEAFWEYGLHPWDMAAAALILERAGGKVCDFNNTPAYLFSGDIIAANDAYFDKFYEIVHKHLGNENHGQ